MIIIQNVNLKELLGSYRFSIELILVKTDNYTKFVGHGTNEQRTAQEKQRFNTVVKLHQYGVGVTHYDIYWQVAGA
jgi:hypothetical protein